MAEVTKLAVVPCSIGDAIEFIRQKHRTHRPPKSGYFELAIVRRGFTLSMREDPPLVRRMPHIPKLDCGSVALHPYSLQVFVSNSDPLPNRKPKQVEFSPVPPQNRHTTR